MIQVEHKDTIINLQGTRIRELEHQNETLRRINTRLRTEKNTYRARLEGLSGLAKEFSEPANGVNCETPCHSNES